MPQWILGIGRWLITNDKTRAYVLADIRSLIMGFGAFAVGKGWLSQDMLLQIATFVSLAIPFYLGHNDVTKVAEKTIPVSAVAKAIAQQKQVDQGVALQMATAIAHAARTAPADKDDLLADLMKGETP